MTLFGMAVLVFCSGCTNFPHRNQSGTTAPRTTISRAKALGLAQSAAASIGGEVYSISPTGSMRPTLDESSFVTIERIAFTSLKEGDIVVYRSADGHPVIHRLCKSIGIGWLALGDSNSRADAEVVSPNNLIGRVFAIFYTSANADPGEPAAIARR